MRVLILTALVLTAAGASGCGTAPDTKEVSPPAPPSPLEQFQRKVERVSLVRRDYVFEGSPLREDLYDAEFRRQYAAGVRWRRHKYWTSSTKYDVRRTDSLVSPYVAELTFILHHAISPDLREDEASAFKDGDPREHFYRDEVHGTFAFQEGKWVNTSLKMRTPSIELLSEWRDATLDDKLTKLLVEEP